MLSMMDAAAEGRFKALWAMGYDVLLTNPDVASTRRSLGGPRAARRAGHLHERDGARVRARGLAVGVLLREGRHVHERRASRAARAQGSRSAPRRGASRLGAALRRGPRAGSGPRVRVRLRGVRSGRRSGACGPRARASPTRASRGRVCSGPARADDHPGTTLLHADAFGDGRARRATVHRVRARRPSGRRPSTPSS